MDLLTVLVFAALAGSAHAACSFPQGACVPSVCAKLNLPDFSPLLDPTKFFANDSGVKTTFSAVPSSLGFYYSTYTDKYNGGVFDQTKKADRDGAPFLNYFELRSSLGYLARTGVSFPACCTACRRASGCALYLFNPYINTKINADLTRTKTFKTTGDCYFLLQSDSGVLWTYDRVNAACDTDGVAKQDSSVKPYFYAGKCNGEISDDPHFVGAHGTRYDFNGELDKSFCLLADQKLQLNALLRGYKAPHAADAHTGIRSWMKELGFVWADGAGQKHSLHLVARAGKQQERGAGFLARVVVDGVELEIPKVPGYSASFADMELSFLGVGSNKNFEVDNYRLVIGDLLDLRLSMRVAHPKLQTPEDAEVHFNLDFNAIKLTESIHGVLGQTYRKTESQAAKASKYSALSKILGAPVQADGKTGQGFLDGEMRDYETSSIVSADCKFSSFLA